jgi:outer membrane receptor protein involved in Fe transport
MPRCCILTASPVSCSARALTALSQLVAIALGAMNASAAESPEPPPSVPLAGLLSFRLTASSFFEVSRESAPGTTTVVDRFRLATAPGRTLADTIEMAVPGMQVSKHLWTGAILGVRGITIDNNAKTLVMLDGLNLNMRTHFGTSGLLSLPLFEDVESLEVGSGPGSLVHGSGALNGYVNLVPRDGATHPGLEATLEVGPVDTSGSAQVSYGMTYGRTNNLFLYAGFAGANGFAPRRDLSWSCTGTSGFTPCPYDSIAAGDLGPSSKLSVNWNHGAFNLLAMFLDAQISTEGNVLDDWFNLQDPWWLSTILAVRPEYTVSLSDRDDLVISAGAQLQDYGLVPRHPRRVDPASYFRKAGAAPRWLEQDVAGLSPWDLRSVSIWNGVPPGGRESAESLRVLVKTLRLPRNSLAFGGELGHRTFERKKQFFGASALMAFEEADFNWLELSAFAEDTFRWDRLTVTGGLRYELFKNPDSFQPDLYTERDIRQTIELPRVQLSNQRALVRRLGLAWSLTAATTVKASYQQGFRNPDASYYTHWAAQEGFLERKGEAPLPPLGNETLDSCELNVSHNVSPAVVATLNSYYNRYRRLLAWNAVKDTFVNAQDDVQSVGGELGVEVAAGGLRLNAAYGHSRPLGYSAAAYELLELTSADRRSWKVFSPHQLKTSVTQSLLGGRLSLSVAAAFYGRVDDPAWAAGQHDRALVNAAAVYHFSGQIQAKVTLQNLTGNTVPAPRLGNDRTQAGNLGIERRLFYLSLGLRL